MRNLLTYITVFITILGFSSCEKNDPITELGDTNGQFSAQLSVSYNNTKPIIGDTVTVTASTWQRDDKIDKIEFKETVFESFGLVFTLEKGTAIDTKENKDSNTSYSTLILSDTIKSKEVWNTVLGKNLDDYWVTSSNNYVIRTRYELKQIAGKYPNDVQIISSLSTVDFEILKSVLAYNIVKADYLLLFPSAPATHFNSAGTALTQLGINNLKANLSKEALAGIVKTISKKGTYNVTIEVDAVTPTGTVTTSTPRTFENTI